MGEEHTMEMPYEKFKRYGLDGLSDSDLLAILLRTGTSQMNVQELAYYLLTDKQAHSHSLLHLYDLSYEQLQKVKGIGKVKALQIKAVLELSKRVSREKYHTLLTVDRPQALADYFMEILRHEKSECFVVTFLDTKCKMMGYEIVSKGSLTASIVHPREVYKLAIQKSAYSIIALHNHPSGDPTPSKEDITATRKIKQAGEIVGIELIDHIIIGDNRYISMRELNLF